MKTKQQYMYILMCFYCVFTVVQNLFEMKSLGTSLIAIMGGGTVVSWIPFMCGDILTEVYNKDTAIKTFTVAAFINLLVVVLAQLVIVIPGPYEDQNKAFELIFSNGIRTATASIIAFMVGSYLNVAVMDKLKSKHLQNDSSHKLFARAVLSTIAGQLLDNGLFLLLAFMPLGISEFEMRMSDIFRVTFSGTAIETIIEMIFVPIITIPFINKLQNKPN